LADPLPGVSGIEGMDEGIEIMVGQGSMAVKSRRPGNPGHRSTYKKEEELK